MMLAVPDPFPGPRVGSGYSRLSRLVHLGDASMKAVSVCLRSYRVLIDVLHRETMLSRILLSLSPTRVPSVGPVQTTSADEYPTAAAIREGAEMRERAGLHMRARKGGGEREGENYFSFCARTCNIYRRLLTRTNVKCCRKW